MELAGLGGFAGLPIAWRRRQRAPPAVVTAPVAVPAVGIAIVDAVGRRALLDGLGRRPDRGRAAPISNHDCKHNS